MRRPKVRVDNIDDVAAFYAEHRPKRAVAAAGYLGMRAIFHPRVRYQEGAQDSIKEILADKSQRLMLVGNHLSNIDPVTLAAMATRPTFWPMIGKTFILAKTPLFRNPALRLAVDELGAVPIFGSSYVTEEERAVDRHSALTRVYADRISQGEHPAAYAGRRKKEGDLTKIDTVGKGLGHIICAVDEEVGVHVLPVGIWYAGRQLTPNMVVGQPYEAPREAPEQFGDALLSRLQSVLDEAVACD